MSHKKILKRLNTDFDKLKSEKGSQFPNSPYHVEERILDAHEKRVRKGIPSLNKAQKRMEKSK